MTSWLWTVAWANVLKNYSSREKFGSLEIELDLQVAVADAPTVGLIEELRGEVRVRKVEEGRLEGSGWRAVRVQIVTPSKQSPPAGSTWIA